MRKISKKDFNGNLVKGLISKFIFTLTYIFVYSLILGSSRPLSFLAKTGSVNTYLVISMILGAIPFTFCGYLIMIARNKRENLEQKNFVLALSIFVISFVFYLIVTGLQMIFEYRSMYDLFILMNYPLLRATQYLDVTRSQLNILMLISTFLPAIFVYLGGWLRLRVLYRGRHHG